MAHVIVLGNEKGGSGKSTVAMHLVVWLARSGRTVGCMDLDIRQQSLFRYLENRKRFAGQRGSALARPQTADIAPSDHPVRERARSEDRTAFRLALDALAARNEFIVIDCPGSHTHLAEAAHDSANTLITPINDSFLDFDLLARVDADSNEVLGPSVYAEAVWNARKARTAAGEPPLDWVVMRNRIAMLDARNRRRVQASLETLSSQIGFRLVPGFSERVIFRELFLHGLTLLDMDECKGLISYSLSHVAGRQELRELVQELTLPLALQETSTAS